MEKVVIIPKKEEENFFNLLPLVEALNNIYEDPEINIVHSINLEKQLSTIPYRVRFFEVSESDYGPVASIKLAAKFNDLFNITHALVYREEVGVMQFVKALKAKERIGWKSLVNEVFLTEGVEKKGPLSYVALLESSKAFNEKLEPLEKIINRKSDKLPENFFKDQSSTPFLFLSSKSFSEDEVLINLSNFMAESLKDGRIIIWSSEGSEVLGDLTKRFDNIVDATEADESQIHHYITRCQSFISTVDWHTQMACYLGVEPFYINSEGASLNSYLKYGPKLLTKVGEDTFSLLEEEEKKELTLDEFVNLVLGQLNL